MNSNKIKVLIIDDDIDNALLIQELLKDSYLVQYQLSHERYFNTALNRLVKEKFDAIILDLNLPDSSGRTSKIVTSKFPDLPIIVLTGIEDEDIAIKALQHGIQDYLIKGKVSKDLITRSIKYAIERKKIENILKEKEKKYRSITDTIIEGLWIVDKEGKTTYVNQQMAEMLGYTIDEILNCPFFDFVDINYLDEAKRNFEKRKQGIKDRYDFSFRKKDGSIIWTIVSASPLFGDKGQFIGAMGLITDITERKKNEEKLRESEEKWRSLTENSPDQIMVINLDGIISFVNRTIPGFIKEQIINSSLYNYIPDKFKQDVRQCFERIKDTKKLDKYYTEYVCPDGKVLNFEVHVGPIIKYDQIIGFVTNASDITERKKIQDQLQQSEERYRTIIEYSNDMIWTLDIEGRFTFFNRRSEKISGYKLEELKGKTFHPLIIKEDIPKVVDVFRNVLNGQFQEYEVTFLNKYNNRITLWVNTAPIWIKGKVVGTASFGRDITENKKSQEKIKRTTEELARSNKELEQFAYIASHDLQEPLRSISGFTELLAINYKGKLDSEADEFIDFIINGTKRMQQLINDLLSLSRVSTRGKEFRPTNVADVINKVLENLHSSIERNSALITIDSMPIVNADESQLVQLFQNLIDNAIKFKKKEVIPQVYISYRQEEDQYIFSVKDNGIGIDPKNFPKLFVIFQRLHKRDEYPGTGIGLAMCKKIVERHNGKIWIESQPGEGSTFYFSIPIKINNN